MGFKKILLYAIITVTVSALLIVSIPGIPPDIEPTSFFIQPPRKVEGWFATNAILDEAELYYEEVLGGNIESIAVQDDNTIYAGNQMGTIFKVTGKQVAEKITTLKFPCDTTNPFNVDGKEAAFCSWPLGMRFDKRGFLYTMDYFGGMTKVDVKTGVYENIVPKSRPINDKFAHVPEDLDIANDGNIYWTDGSTTGNFFTEMLSGPSGRFIKYDPVLRKNEVLLKNLYFSNGVCLSDDETFVLITESGSARIIRYHLSGKMKGSSDVFVDALPGYPDNIRSNGRGGFYVALVVPWNDEHSMRVHLLSTRPMLRKLIVRSRHLLLRILGYLKAFLPDNVYIRVVEQYVDQGEPILNMNKMPKTATIVELSKSGEIIGILNGKNGKISGLSHISVGKKYAFLCSPIEGKIWRIKTNVLRRMH